MKKISIFILMFSMALMLALTPKAHAYTLSNQQVTYYNQSTATIGQADLLDIADTYIEYMYFNLGDNSLYSTTTRVVFTNIITTEILPFPYNESKSLPILITFYDINDTILFQHESRQDQYTSFSYFETNFSSLSGVINNIEYITIKISNLSIGYNEDTMHQIMNGAIIARGYSIINQTVGTIQYNNGWTDAMNSKVTQIWSLWGNIFDTFMNVFDIFSVQLVGDITIGHIAMVPLVLGLIGFIYALGGKRGR